MMQTCWYRKGEFSQVHFGISMMMLNSDGKINIKIELIDGTETATSMQTERIRHDAETRVRYETRTLSAFTFGFEGTWEIGLLTLN